MAVITLKLRQLEFDGVVGLMRTEDLEQVAKVASHSLRIQSVSSYEEKDQIENL